MTKITIACLALLLTISCKKNEIVNQEMYAPAFILANFTTPQLENPYSVANMTIAADNIQSAINVTTTHYYVKFSPQDEVELEILEDDLALELSDYPLDYEPQEEGSEGFHDARVHEEMPTYQYAAVKLDYVFPQVQYEILEELFIPEELEDYQTFEDEYDALIDEAFLITNNVDYYKTAASKYTPEGKIELEDSYSEGSNIYTRIVPLSGVRVTARNWFRTKVGITDVDGIYTCDGSFKRKVQYKVVWQRDYFKVNESRNKKARYNGPKQKEDWNWTITSATYDQQRYYAIIFKAAMHYYYGNISGLRRPKQTGSKMKFIATGTNNAITGKFGEYNDRIIELWNKDTKTSEYIYATALHEIAHSSHHNAVGGANNYSNESYVTESWAVGVMWELTKMTYASFDIDALLIGKTNNYTQIVIDMTTSTNYGPSDYVSGYTIKQIEDALVNDDDTWNDWRDAIKAIDPSNPTKSGLDALFAYWKP